MVCTSKAPHPTDADPDCVRGPNLELGGVTLWHVLDWYVGWPRVKVLYVSRMVRRWVPNHNTPYVEFRQFAKLTL